MSISSASDAAVEPAGAPQLSIVLPALNEAENVSAVYQALCAELLPLNLTFELLFVDDGSTDATFEEVSKLAGQDSRVRGVALSRNFGHQVAVVAGMEAARGTAVITMDADLQHPPAVIGEMWRRYTSGADIVIAIPEDRRSLSPFKRYTSGGFYWLLNQLSDIPVLPSGAEFRLLSRRACEQFLRFSERTRFNRGLVQWMGFRQEVVPYTVQARRAGTSKYTVQRMLALAFDGIFSFSSRPLRMFLYAGICSVTVSLVYGLYAIVVYLGDRTVQGWTSLLLSVLFLGGLQLMGIGILGEYIGRIFHEVKGRPLYIVRSRTWE